MLILLFDEAAGAPIDPATGAPVSYCQDRLQYFLNVYSRPKGAKIVVHTPALGEFLVKVSPQKAPEYISQLQRIRGVLIAPFSLRAALEFAQMQQQLLAERRKAKPRELEGRAKAKFDQQIVAIAKVESASTIYTDDQGLKNYAARFGINAIGIAELPLSPNSAQGKLPLEDGPSEVGDDA